MSVDTTMAILKTRRPFSPQGQYEFRVALVQAVENAFPELTDGWREELFRAWWLARAFGRSAVYPNAKSARKVARRKAYRARNRGILEYGVVTVDNSDQAFPLLPAEQLEVLLREHKVFPFNRTRR